MVVLWATPIRNEHRSSKCERKCWKEFCNVEGTAALISVADKRLRSN